MKNNNYSSNKIIITGSEGGFAKNLKKYLYGKKIHYLSHTQIDILNLKQIKKCLDKYKPDIFIHLAAVSRPMAIHDEDISHSIETNIIGTANVVKACSEKNIKLIYMSTAYVYPGNKGNYKENDGVLPFNNYGWSKLGGEASVQMYKNSLILRPSMTEYPFLHQKAFKDAKANFLYREEVAQLVPKLLNEKGVINIGGKNETIFEFAKKSNKKVKPISVKVSPNFPINSCVNILKLKKILNKKNSIYKELNVSLKSKVSKTSKIIKAAGPSISNLEIEIVNDMMRNGWENYSYVEKFEKEFARFHNRKFALMVPSCTLAIHLLLKTLRIGPGDEVIVPETTWTASVAPVVEVGAKPVFVDIKEDTWCIDESKIQKKINSKTRAIIFVDLYGNFPDIYKLKKIAKRNNIFLIEDAAEALGSIINGIRAGKFGIGSVHSFHRTKTITSGEGGMLLIDNLKIYKRAKFLRDLGRSNSDPYIAEEASLKYMPSNFQASLAYGQFKRINNLLHIKKNAFNLYKKYLTENGISFQINNNNKKIVNGCWATTIVYDRKYKISSAQVIKNLSKKKIPSRTFFHPLTSQRAYKRFSNTKKNAVSYEIYKRGITLPCHYNLTEIDIKKICFELSAILNKN